MIFKPVFLSCIFLAMSVITYTQMQPSTPPMGWNSWDSYGKFPTEKAMLANIKLMAEKLKPFGYNYFVIDAGWNIEKDAGNNITHLSMDEYGRYVPAISAFPNGLKPVIEAAHKAGLKFGIHIMRGIPREAYNKNLLVPGTTYSAQNIADTTSVCKWNHDNYGVNMNNPGAQEYYDSYIAMLINWGIDFIKADDITGHPDEIKAVESAITKTGKNIVLSLSPGGDSKTEYINVYNQASMLRITGDVWDNQKGIDKVFDAWKKWNAISRKDLWLDMDMIPFGHLCLNNSDPNYLHAATGESEKGSKGKERMCSFTKDQQYTFITQRALGASPLFMGGDLPTTDEFSFSLLTSKEMLACNQNGVIGKLVYENDSLEVWKTPNRKNANEGWIGIFNRSGENKNVQLSSDQLQIMPCSLFDIWKNKSLENLGVNTVLKQEINAHGVIFFRYKYL
jgi:hypothetical protein